MCSCLRTLRGQEDTQQCCIMSADRDALCSPPYFFVFSNDKIFKLTPESYFSAHIQLMHIFETDSRRCFIQIPTYNN